VIDKAGLVNVYLNGVRLTDADYTIDAAANSVTLDSGATVGDIVEIEVFGNFAGQSGADVAITGGSITGLTELSTGTFTSTGIDDNATSTAITIDSSENVGIGTGSPDNALEVGGEGILRLRPTTDNSQGALYFNDMVGTSSYRSDIGIINNGGLYFKTTSSLNTAPTERARIDSSGNLLVGKTSTNFNTDGFQAFSGGFVHATTTQGTANSGTVITVNRKSTDGSIVDLKKDGSTVGSIGSLLGGVSFGGGDTAIRMADGSDAIQPFNNTTNLTRNAAISLGTSGSRFKDLYLSGGVYLGGTGSANKLDDYEEGTFSPNALATFSVYNCTYAKVGRIVLLNIDVQCPSSASGTPLQLGIPFIPANSYAGSGTISYTANPTNCKRLEVNNNNSRLQVRRSDYGFATFADASGVRIIGSVVYETDQ
jgi:hypothetical protein